MHKNHLLVVAFLAYLSFFLGTDVHGASKSVLSQTKATIAPILELTVAEQGNSELKFGSIRPSALDPTVAGPITVQINVVCNSGERYQVSQATTGPLSNLTGAKIDLEKITFRSAGAKTAGTGVSVLSPISESAQVIFTSDASGTSDSVLTEYYLNVPPAQEPGDYSTNMIYTVSTL